MESIHNQHYPAAPNATHLVVPPPHVLPRALQRVAPGEHRHEGVLLRRVVQHLQLEPHRLPPSPRCPLLGALRRKALLPHRRVAHGDGHRARQRDGRLLHQAGAD